MARHTSMHANFRPRTRMQPLVLPIMCIHRCSHSCGSFPPPSYTTVLLPFGITHPYDRRPIAAAYRSLWPSDSKGPVCHGATPRLRGQHTHPNTGFLRVRPLLPTQDTALHTCSAVPRTYHASTLHQGESRSYAVMHAVGSDVSMEPLPPDYYRTTSPLYHALSHSALSGFSRL